jgi:hypothetical protein
VAGPTNNIAGDFRDHLKSSSEMFQVYSLEVDHSTDFQGHALLLIFIGGCTCNSNVVITEERLELTFMHGTATKEDIFL